MIGRGERGQGDGSFVVVEEGAALLREEPLAAAPLAAHCEAERGGASSSSVCYGCLRPLRGRPPPAAKESESAAAAAPPPPPLAPPPPLVEGVVLHSGCDGDGDSGEVEEGQTRTFCSSSCLDASLRSFYRIESEIPGGFRELEECCKRHGERFPRIAARLLSRSLLAAVVAAEAEQEEAKSIIKAAREAEEALAALCFARVSPPPYGSYPPSWEETHRAFLQGLERWAKKKENEKEKRGEGGGGEGFLSLSSLIAQTVPLDAWAACLARIHLNAFRVDAVMPATTREELLASMLSSLVGSGSGSSSSSRGSPSSSSADSEEDIGEQCGTAIYAAASLANHSCYPTARPSFPRASATLALVATRDLVEGDEVTISYVDELLPLEKRRAALEYGYGFFCRCERCVAEEEGRGGGGGFER